ncbi:MAG TPA: hypothetical protein VM431_02070 [Phycisphaerae bacterium]|nr:hypothetical protein [Phycisphaerae bacterium]
MRPAQRTGVLAVAALALAVLAAASGAADAGTGRDVRRPKKLIAVGWDLFFDTHWLLAHHAEMDQRPFDGITINVVGRDDDGKPVEMRLAFRKGAWKEAWFDAARADLVACKFRNLRDNFLMVWANPGDVDWFDDDGWRDIVEHWRLAARLAKRSGCRGLCFDPEPYYGPHAAFTYAAQTGRQDHSFAAYAAKVRERGREVMKAVAAEFPEATILAFFLNSICGRATGHADPAPLLEADGYGLLPAFVDGWLDAAPPTVTMVDGHEHAYRYNSDVEFLEGANLIRNTCQEFVSPENRAKYRAQVQVGYGVYLDAHINPPTSPWYIDPLGGPRVERLRANVAAACRAADEYVWVYGEKCRWWPTPNKRVTERTWPEALPGCEDALRFARDPVAGARWKVEELRKASALQDLMAGGDFLVGPKEAGGRPDGWGAWQDSASKGAFAWDADVGAAAKGSARLAGVANGCLIAKIEVKPGQRYAVEAVRRLKGAGDAVLVVRWQTADDTWTAEARDVSVPCTGPRDAWAEMFGVAEVPEGAGKLVVLLLARGQKSADDLAWFDDVRVYRLDGR